MATVYLAVLRSTVASKVVVLKQLRPDLAEEEDFAAMFVDESRVALRLHHPNVIHAYEASSDDGRYFLSMEFLQGKTLSEILRRVGRRRMPRHLHLYILTQVLKGLSYAHELKDFDGSPLGIVHRDVSPSNVLITREGDVKLVDFGIAKLAGSLSQTQRGTVKGKVGYAAPEQCLGNSTDARADIYSIGVMLWEAIAGCRRTAGDNPLLALKARIHNLEADLADVHPDAPDELLSITRKALAHAPEDRYPSARALLEDLEKYFAKAEWAGGKEQAAKLVESKFGDELAETRRLIEVEMGSSGNSSLRALPRESNTPAHFALVGDAPHDASRKKRARPSVWQAVGIVAVAAVMGFSWPAYMRLFSHSMRARPWAHQSVAAMTALAELTANIAGALATDTSDPLPETLERNIESVPITSLPVALAAPTSLTRSIAKAPPRARHGGRAASVPTPATEPKVRHVEFEPGDDLGVSRRRALAARIDEGNPYSQ